MSSPARPSPLVTICMPVYNALPYLTTTLESVLAQTFTDYEVIIRDDRSTDGTYEWLTAHYGADPRFTLHRNSVNLDVGPQYNRLFLEARGKYVLKLDSDDLIDPTMLEKLVALAEAREADFAAAGYETFLTETNARARPKVHARVKDGEVADPLAMVLLHNPFSLCFSIWRRSMLDRIARDGQFILFTETCDWELQIRIALSGGRFVATTEALGQYRLHATNRSHRSNGQLRSVVLDVLPYWLEALDARLGRGVVRRFVARNFIAYLRQLRRRPKLFDHAILGGFLRLALRRPRFPEWCLNPAKAGTELPLEN